MAVFPNNEALLFTNWLLTPGRFRFSGPRKAIIQFVQIAAATSSSTTNNIWNNFNMITAPLYSRYRQYVDLTNTTFTVEFLLIGGGGGGGSFGGGGAGEIIYTNLYGLSIGTFPVVIGAGGTGSPTSMGIGTNGNNSTFDTSIATGGGGGGAFSTTLKNGLNGACGGGGGCWVSGSPAFGTGGLGLSGFNGGDGDGSGIGTAGGGGGGFGGVGLPVTAIATGGNGGAGVSYSISGVPTFYAGGGGGAGGTTKGLGGSGIGGNGAKYPTPSPTVPTANTGSGGGGSYASTDATNGADGVFILSYPTGSIVCTGGTITTSGGNTIHTFNANGTLTRIS